MQIQEGAQRPLGNSCDEGDAVFEPGAIEGHLAITFPGRS